MKCEICDEVFEFCDKHHIHSLALGGADKPYNIAIICPNCHRQTHKGMIIIEGRYLVAPDGVMLIWRRRGNASITGNPDPPCWRIE